MSHPKQKPSERATWNKQNAKNKMKISWKLFEIWPFKVKSYRPGRKKRQNIKLWSHRVHKLFHVEPLKAQYSMIRTQRTDKVREPMIVCTKVENVDFRKWEKSYQQLTNIWFSTSFDIFFQNENINAQTSFLFMSEKNNNTMRKNNPFDSYKHSLQVHWSQIWQKCCFFTWNLTENQW